ncbi:MAG: cytochrome c biogenesis protein CcdA [Chloroflexi bacterium]|nr:cytochrome c biogenesis protein CcdA [Chloroflexota bacterium]
MGVEQVTLPIAFAAGVVSFVSPCVLPLVPAYVANLAGVSLSPGAPATRMRLAPPLHALFFVLGFTLVFVLFWTSLGLIGYLVQGYMPYIRFGGGVILIFMGFHVMGLWRIPFLERELRTPFSLNGKVSYPRSFFLGIVFAAGWAPCIGPVLAGIIGLASLRETVWQGAYLLIIYSLGLGIPFLATALAINPATRFLRRVNRYQWAISGVSGVLLIAIGVLMMTNMFVRIPKYFYWGAL